MGFQEICI